MQSGDTIVAISSAAGAAARMIVRLGGDEARRIASSIANVERIEPAAAVRLPLNINGMSVLAWVYFFAGPRSYTGEDIVEFHIPGNPLAARMLLEELTARGARPAEPGEFTARAYFHGRMDLPAAEAVAATIAAHSQRELRAARQLLAGELARRLRPVLEMLADSLALVEVGIDFSEEDVTFISHTDLRQRLARATAQLDALLADSARFEQLSHEPRIVLVGRANAGKSTLLNALAGEHRAVVSAEAGTTRDVLWSQVRLPRGMVRIVDIAGIDEHPSGEIAMKMLETARRAIDAADLVVLVQDVTDERPTPVLPVPIDLTVRTKRDLLPPGEPMPEDSDSSIAVSAATGAHLDALRERLDRLAFGAAAPGATLALNARHVECVRLAGQALERADASIAAAGPEVIALELREALDQLGAVVGSVTPDDVLGRIFAGFCVGK